MNRLLPIKAKPPRNASYPTPARSGFLQRKCACGGTPGPTGECDACRKKRLQRKTQNSGLGTRNDSEVPPIVHEVLRSPGQPLDADTRTFMEPRFGHDFSAVRVHNDIMAAESARAVESLAYTVGSDVVFGTGQYTPGTPHGDYLLAHELTHVIQQENAATSRGINMPTAGESGEIVANKAAAYVATATKTDPAFPAIGRSQLTLAKGEKWADFWGVGPWDSYKAKQLAEAALSKAQKTGLPGLHNGAADAWRHCYWNCTMTAEIGADQAEEVASNHEKYGGGPANENSMDIQNNAKGRACGGKNCDGCCQTKLDAGELRVIDSKSGAVVPSGPTARSTTPAAGSGAYKY